MSKLKRLDYEAWLRPVGYIIPSECPAYQGEDWNSSWVRSHPHRLDSVTDGAPYSTNQVAALSHKALASLDSDRRLALLTLHLYAYLEFTKWVELDLVNHANRDLGIGNVLPFLPRSGRIAALRIYTDEAGHTEFTDDLLARVQREYGVPAITPAPFTTAQRRLDEHLSLVSRDKQSLVRIFWTIASETLITSNLTAVANDGQVASGIRAVLQDHATDEAVHHLYFAWLLRALWPNLTSDGQLALGIVIAEALEALVSLDQEWLSSALEAIGVDRARAIAEEVTGCSETIASLRKAANPTLKLLRSLGAFNDAQIAAVYGKFRLTD